MSTHLSNQNAATFSSLCEHFADYAPVIEKLQAEVQELQDRLAKYEQMAEGEGS